MESREKMLIAANAANEKKAKDLVAFYIGNISALAEYIVIASATSSSHVRALAEDVEEKMMQSGLVPHHIEGKATGWILLDYDNVLIHIFDKQMREFYGLDRIWSDGDKIDLAAVLNTEMEED